MNSRASSAVAVLRELSSLRMVAHGIILGNLGGMKSTSAYNNIRKPKMDDVYSC